MSPDFDVVPDVSRPPEVVCGRVRSVFVGMGPRFMYRVFESTETWLIHKTLGSDLPFRMGSVGWET